MQATLELSLNGSGPALRDAPGTVSARRHLRQGMPDLYRRDAAALRDKPPPFAMRFLEALEEVLDPVVATLDSLPSHFDVDLAPVHALAGIATWFGVDDVETLPAEQRREAVRRAGELARMRGTHAGLQLVLSIFFPDVAIRIRDKGSVIVMESVDDVPEEPPPAAFDVFCEQALSPDEQMAIDRCIERWKPAHVQYTLRVKRGAKAKTVPELPQVEVPDEPIEMVTPPPESAEPPPAAAGEPAPDDDAPEAKDGET